MSSYSMIRQTVENSNRAENDRRVQLKASQVVKERIKKPTLPLGPEGTEGSRALAGGKRITEKKVKEQGGEGDVLHRDLYGEYLDKKEYYESLPEGSPQEDEAETNMSDARFAWANAVIESAEYALQRG